MTNVVQQAKTPQGRAIHPNQAASIGAAATTSTAVDSHNTNAIRQPRNDRRQFRALLCFHDGGVGFLPGFTRELDYFCCDQKEENQAIRDALQHFIVRPMMVKMYAVDWSDGAEDDPLSSFDPGNEKAVRPMVDWSPYLMTEEQVRDRMATENADAKFNLDVLAGLSADDLKSAFWRVAPYRDQQGGWKAGPQCELVDDELRSLVERVRDVNQEEEDAAKLGERLCDVRAGLTTEAIRRFAELVPVAKGDRS